MNILRKLTLRDLKLNKKRTIGTLVGVILSCALIVVVLGMLVVLQNSIFKSQVNNNGYYHARINKIDENEIEKIKEKDYVSEVIVTNNIGSTYYDEDSNYTGDIYSMNKETFDKLSYHIIEGEFPKNENELLINRSFMYQHDLKVGDYYEMEIGDVKRIDYYASKIINSRTQKYKIVGVIDRYGDLVTTNTDSDVHNAYVILKNPNNYKSDLINLLGSGTIRKIESKYEDFSVNVQVLIWETMDFSDQAISILTTIIGIVLFVIIVTSIFSIRNSFAISISEKMKMYGMLTSVGATKKQIIRMVLFEGLVIGLIGISLGLLLGIGVNVLLVFIINTIANNANLFGDGFSMVYKFSFIPIILAVVLSLVVIFLSVITSATKASRVSPIQNIRNSDDIKAKKLRTPGIIKKLFGIGGVLSYKNLKRSKKKYRVTIVSLTISIFIYILVSTFVEYTLNIIREEYASVNYNISATASYEKDDVENEIINKFESLDKAYINYYTYIEDNRIDFEGHVISDTIKFDIGDGLEDVAYSIMLYNENGFRDYVDKLKLDYDEVKDKLIVVNELKNEFSNRRNEYVTLTDYKKGDTISIGNKRIEIAEVTKTRPIGLEDLDYSRQLYLIGSVDNFPKIEGLHMHISNAYYNSDEPYKLAKTLEDLNCDDYIIYVDNLDEQISQVRSMILILSIIVYGFIIVVTFIGVTSVFNTINSNMELRSRDFATLKSVGMTKKEFNNMINLEAIFYSVKSLLYGIVLGLIGSYVVFSLLSNNYIFEYRAPIKSIGIAIVFIIILILIIMRYSIKKINKQNIIETIRNSNI